MTHETIYLSDSEITEFTYNNSQQRVDNEWIWEVWDDSKSVDNSELILKWKSDMTY